MTLPTSRWPLNGKGTTGLIGAIILALATLFGFLGAVPWATKAEVAAMKVDMQRELSEIKSDVREILRELRAR